MAPPPHAEQTRPPRWFAAAWCAAAGAAAGYLTARGAAELWWVDVIAGAAAFAALAAALTATEPPRWLARLLCMGALGAPGALAYGTGYGLLMAALGYLLGGAALWLASGRYRRRLPPYAAAWEVLWFYALRGVCGLVFLFLVVPILVLIPLSFNQEPYFSFTVGMLNFEPDAWSLRWYADILHSGMAAPAATAGWWADLWQNARWVQAIKNSFLIGIPATLLATALGTLAAVGLSRSEMPFRRAVMALLISPMVVPLVITASGVFYAFSTVALAKTYAGLILAHAVLGVPFVVITVTATLAGFDRSLVHAAASLGASHLRTFFQVQLPLILPGVMVGALFAFITSFDEVVVVLQMADVTQRTLPRQMFTGLREQISPTILAVATIFVLLSALLLLSLELVRRRTERLHAGRG